MVSNSKRDVFIRTLQCNIGTDIYLSSASGPGFEVGTDCVDAQLIICRIFQTAIAVVGHYQVGTISVIEHCGESLDGLLIDKRDGLAVDRGTAQLLSRGRA